MKFKQGFTLIEVLLVVAVGVVIFAFSAPYSLNFYRSQLLNEAQSNIISALQQARHDAVLQKNDSAFGVHMIPESYTIFQGEDFDDDEGVNGRDSNQDEVYSVISSITFSGVTDIYFNKLTGLPDLTGTTTITFGTISREILIGASGEVSKIE